jgi:hypothetical protein
MVVIKKGLFSSLATAIVAALILAGIYVHFHNKNKNKVADANTSIINLLGKSKSLDDQRSLASAYLAAGKYMDAEQTMKDIATKTNSTTDYTGLLNICTVRAVPDKTACVDNTVSKLKPQINNLSFFQAYSIASELDESGFSKQAISFYQRAYDTYDPARADQYTKTKDQIKQRIGELSA